MWISKRFRLNKKLKTNDNQGCDYEKRFGGLIERMDKEFMLSDGYSII